MTGARDARQLMDRRGKRLSQEIVWSDGGIQPANCRTEGAGVVPQYEHHPGVRQFGAIA